MWTSTSFVAAVCLLLMLLHAGDSQPHNTTASTAAPVVTSPSPVVTSPATTSNADNTATTTTPTPNTVTVNSAAGGLGEACNPGQPGNCTDANHVCDLNDPTGHKVCRIKHGQNCSGSPDNCTNGASCRGNMCNCTHERPSTTSGLCSVEVNHNCADTLQCGNNICEKTVCKIPVAQSCKRVDHCVAGANCTGQRCACVHGWKTNNQNNTCVPILLAGHSCTKSGTRYNDPNHAYWCTANSNCDPGACNCTSEYYESQHKECLPRIRHGQDCSFEHPYHPCVDGAKCREDTSSCECVTEDYFVYVQATDKCTKQKGYDETGCNDTIPCVPGSTCNPNNHTCICDDDYFAAKPPGVHHISLCEPRKSGDGSECSGDAECVQNAHCNTTEGTTTTTPPGTTAGHCRCKDHFYLTAEGRCNNKLPWDGVCQHSINDECLEHGFCDAHEHCKCRDYAYRKLDNTCAPTLNYNTACELMNRDSKQCGNGTQCVFRSNDQTPVCACDIDHFFQGSGCAPRILVGNPCAYIDRTFQALKENQCVENAQCDFATYHICVCDGGHYSREGYCPAQVAAGDTCDPWDHNENQCADYNTCVQGRCQ